MSADETTPITDDASPAKAGTRVAAVVFAVVAAAFFVWFVVYWFLTYEPAGSTMLLLTIGMMALLAVYVLLHARRHADPAEVGPPASLYLPHASLWPFAIGVGAVLVGNGLALGAWAVFPGAILLGYGLWGFARQSRRRD
jgi:hypothetical protein